MSHVGYWLVFIGSGLAIIGGFLINRANHQQGVDNIQLQEQNNQLLDDVRSLSAKNVELSEKNVSLSEKVEAYATGADSYFYFHFTNFGTPQAQAEIRVAGNNPIRNALVEVFDLNDVLPKFVAKPSLALVQDRRVGRTRIDSIASHQSMKWTHFPFETPPEKILYSYFFIINAENMTVQQFTQVMLINDGWKQSYSVHRISPGTGEPSVLLVSHKDEGFPEVPAELRIREKTVE